MPLGRKQGPHDQPADGEKLTPLQSDTLAKKAGGRDTARKRAILLMLEQHNEHDYSERRAALHRQPGCGLHRWKSRQRGPPCEAWLLLGYWWQYDTVTMWNAIAQNFIEMPVTAYYSARTMERDKV
jgi:hypothetical protein